MHNILTRNFLLALLGAVFLLLPKQIAIAKDGIDWKPWGTAAFDKAKAENRLIFVDVGTEWCSACNTMSETTYQEKKVHKLLAEHFVAIHVDAEADPDVGERYGFWGWPALVFMTPKGEHVHFVRGNMLAEDFVWLLNLMKDRFADGKLEEVNFKIDLARKPVSSPLDAMVKNARSHIDAFYDEENDGWGRMKMPFHDLVQQALWRGRTSDPVWRERALNTARKMERLRDPVWGGIFFGASGNWSGLIHERRTEHQASAIFMFAEAYAATGDKRWLKNAERVIGFLDTMFKSRDGAYFTSQEMEVDGADVSPHAYFAKGDAERRKIGLPRIDTTIYADINGKLAMALARLYEASRDQAHLERALRIGHQLAAAHAPQGWVRQILAPSRDANTRLRVLPDGSNEYAYLRAQAFTGLAYLRLYRATGDDQWFKAAHGLGKAMLKTLWYEPASSSPDAETGPAFLGSNRDVLKPNGDRITDRPLVDNAAAAEFLLRLASYGNGKLKSEELALYRTRAETALRGVSDAELLKDSGLFTGQYVLALHVLRDEFIEVTVVCNGAHPIKCSQLHKTALHDVNHARKLVKIEKPGRYPDTGEPSAFVCTSKLCSNPLAASDPDAGKAMREFMVRLDDISRAQGAKIAH